MEPSALRGNVPRAGLRHAGHAPSPSTRTAALDGLRCLAVVLVVCYHSGLYYVRVGYVGVDAFFVLSGYVVTLVIADGLAAGSFSLFDFYGRRVRRLLPLAILTLVGVSVGWLLVSAPSERVGLLHDVRAAALYVANWHFAGQATDYFAQSASPSPVLHFWSLAVEEQFYFVWPLLMLGLWRLGRRQFQALNWLLPTAGMSIMALSLSALALAAQHGADDHAFYGTDARAYQLLAGAVIVPRLRKIRADRAQLKARSAGALQMAGFVGFGLAASTVVSLAPTSRGLLSVAGVVALIAGLEMRPRLLLGRLLSSSGVVFVGSVSYAVYLFHYPLILLLGRYVSAPPLVVAAITLLVSISLATVSQRLIEQPVRASRLLARHPRPVVAAGLALSLATGFVAAPALLGDLRPASVLPVDAGAARLIGETGSGSATLPSSVRESLASLHTQIGLKAAQSLPVGALGSGAVPKHVSCTSTPFADCVVVRGRSDARRVLLLGDSHAEMLLPALRVIATQENLTLLIASQRGCPWMLDIEFANSGAAFYARCEAIKTYWYSTLVPDFKPDLVILASRATDHAEGRAYSVVSPDGRYHGDQSELVSAAATATLAEVREVPRTIIIQPLPVAPERASGETCVQTHAYADECAFEADVSPSPLEQSYAADARMSAGAVDTLDLDRVVCPRLPTCDAVLNGALVRKDTDHLTARMAAQVSPQLDLLLHEHGDL